MTGPRIVERPAFDLLGKKTWIAGVEDNDAFGRFWEQARAEGLFALLERIGGLRPGPQTGGVTLGVSRVEKDPANRAFYYMIAIENPSRVTLEELESFRVPAAAWAVFPCLGPLPDAIVAAEIYAFTQWLPASGFVHALAPEMEVYPPNSGESDSPAHICEFWLPIARRA